MKKIFILIFVLVMSSITVNATDLVKENFEGYTVGAIESLTGMTGMTFNTYTAVAEIKNHFSIVQENSNKYLMSYTNANDTPALYKLTPFSNKLMIKFSVKDNKAFSTLLIRGTGTVSFVLMQMRDNNLWVNGVNTGIPYISDQWYNVMVFLDFNNRTFDLTFNNINFNSNKFPDAVTDASVNASSASMRFQIQNTNPTGSTISMSLDNVNISTVSSSVLQTKDMGAFNENGDSVTGITQGLLTFKTGFMNTSNQDMPLIMAAIVYNGDEIVDMVLSSHTINAAKSVDIQNKIFVPSSAGLKVVVMVWDGLNTMNVISPKYLLE